MKTVQNIIIAVEVEWKCKFNLYILIGFMVKTSLNIIIWQDWNNCQAITFLKNAWLESNNK